jgi:hypothetical protein
MGTTKRRYSKEEIVKRGEAIFDSEIKSRLRGRRPTDFVLIDIETHDHEVGANHMAAHNRLRERNPDAQIYVRRVGSRAVYHFGGRVRPGEQ